MIQTVHIILSTVHPKLKFKNIHWDDALLSARQNFRVSYVCLCCQLIQIGLMVWFIWGLMPHAAHPLT